MRAAWKEQHSPIIQPQVRPRDPTLPLPRCLKHVKVLAVLELAVLLAEQPGQHLPGFHAGTHHASGFVPVPSALCAAVRRPILRAPLDGLQSNLIQNPDQQIVHVVVYADRDLDELHPIGAGHALAICVDHVDMDQKRGGCIFNPGRWQGHALGVWK